MVSTTIATPKFAGKRVAFVIAEPWHSVDWSIDLGLQVSTMHDLGHDACLICTRIDGPKRDFPAFEATLSQMEDPDYWRAKHFDIVVVVNWLVRARTVIRALRAANVFLMQKGDGDGLEGMQIHPMAQVNRAWYMRHKTSDRLGAMWMLFKKYIYTHRKEDAILLDNLRNCDATTLESELARRNFLRFAAACGAQDLSNRVSVICNPVSETFLRGDVPERPRARVVAVGRWNDAQKDAPLLARALTTYLQSNPDSVATIIGGGGESHFADLINTCKNASYVGKIPHSDIREQLETARILLFASRWEGSPVVANEMLALGGAVVGPASLPGIRSIVESGPFGTVAAKRTASGLSNALSAEMDAWNRGDRRPREIAAFWRPQLDPSRIAQRILDMAANSRVGAEAPIEVRLTIN